MGDQNSPRPPARNNNGGPPRCYWCGATEQKCRCHPGPWRRLWLRITQILCRHELAWVRNIHGDEAICTGCRTVWVCEKCDKLICDRDYFSREMAVKVARSVAQELDAARWWATGWVRAYEETPEEHAQLGPRLTSAQNRYLIATLNRYRGRRES